MKENVALPSTGNKKGKGAKATMGKGAKAAMGKGAKATMGKGAKATMGKGPLKPKKTNTNQEVKKATKLPATKKRPPPNKRPAEATNEIAAGGPGAFDIPMIKLRLGMYICV